MWFSYRQGQIQELKQAQVPSIAQLRSAMLDPAVNLLFERMKKEVESLKARLEETQNELNAWKFTPDRCDSLTSPSWKYTLIMRTIDLIENSYFIADYNLLSSTATAAPQS